MSADAGLLLLYIVGRVHHGNVGPNGTQLAHQIFVATLDKLNLAELGGAVGGKTFLLYELQLSLPTLPESCTPLSIYAILWSPTSSSA